MSQPPFGTVIIESLYHREQFQDWVGGGKLEIGPTTCMWRAYNSGAGFGWDIEPVAEERGWSVLSDEQAVAALSAVQHTLEVHRYEYRF